MSKGLKALDRLSAVASMYCDECATSEEDLDRGMFEKDYQAVKTIEKELRALEIIKEKASIDLLEELNDDEPHWLDISCGTKLTKEEYDLLKDVLL